MLLWKSQPQKGRRAELVDNQNRRQRYLSLRALQLSAALVPNNVFRYCSLGQGGKKYIDGGDRKERTDLKIYGRGQNEQ